MARNAKTAYELTDAEKRDLTQLIQEGRALPEKYRFVLFEDKREVELVRLRTGLDLAAGARLLRRAHVPKPFKQCNRR